MKTDTRLSPCSSAHVVARSSAPQAPFSTAGPQANLAESYCPSLPGPGPHYYLLQSGSPALGAGERGAVDDPAEAPPLPWDTMIEGRRLEGKPVQLLGCTSAYHDNEGIVTRIHR